MPSRLDIHIKVKYTLQKVVLGGIVLNNRIREKRMDNQLTQEQLASLLHVSRQTIISLEKGKYKPSLPLAHKLAVVFNCIIEDIFIFDKEDDVD